MPASFTPTKFKFSIADHCDTYTLEQLDANPSREIAPGKTAGDILEKIYAEFKESGISPELTAANVKVGAVVLDDDGGITNTALGGAISATKQKTHSSLGTAAARAIKFWEDTNQDLINGFWFTEGETLGAAEISPYIKPFNPKTKGHGGKVKTLKYLNLQGYAATPIYPVVPAEFGEPILARYGVEMGENFWTTVLENEQIPVAITEGLKKALALIEMGIPAVAVRGIWNIYDYLPTYDEVLGLTDKKHKRENRKLTASLEALKGHEVIVVYDQDTKKSTVENVERAKLALIRMLDKIGCKTATMGWDPAMGKGVDDYFRAALDASLTPEEIRQTLISSCKGGAEMLKEEQVSWALAEFARNRRLQVPAVRETVGNYIPTLPKLEEGTLTVVDAPTGSGKTTQLKKIRAEFPDDYMLVLGPSNALTRQIAETLQVVHRRSAEFSWELSRSKNGLAGCAEALESICDVKPWNDRPLILVLDEFMQIFAQITSGKTSKSSKKIIRLISFLLKRALSNGKVIAMEADVNRHNLAFLMALAEHQTPDVYIHKRERPATKIDYYAKSAKFVVDRLDYALVNGEKVFICTDSKTISKRLYKYLVKNIEDLKCLRIDADSAEDPDAQAFVRDPNTEALRWDVVITSPSVKSGLSIDCDHFDHVMGFFTHLPFYSAMQQLARVRSNVPRTIYAKATMGYDPRALYQTPAQLMNFRKNMACQTLSAYTGVAIAEYLNDYNSDSIDVAITEYQGQERRRQALACYHNEAMMLNALKEANYDINFCDETYQGGNELWKEALEQVHEDDAQAIANAPYDPLVHTQEWRRSMQNSSIVTYEERQLMTRVFLHQQFPGVDFTDVSLVKEAIIKSRKTVSGVQLLVNCQNIDHVREADKAAIAYTCETEGEIDWRSTPKNFLKAKLMADCGVLELLDGRHYYADSPEVANIFNFVLKWSDAFYYAFGFNFNKQSVPMRVVNQLVRELGFLSVSQKQHKANIEAGVESYGCVCVGKIGSAGEQKKVYSVKIGGYYEMLLEAHKAKVQKDIEDGKEPLAAEAEVPEDDDDEIEFEYEFTFTDEDLADDDDYDDF